MARPPVLAVLPGRAGDPLVVRAERRHTEARRDRLAADVVLGRATHTLVPLAALTAEHPLDEPLQALRIRALRAAGRQAEALQAYEDVRTALADRLSTDPAPSCAPSTPSCSPHSRGALPPRPPGSPPLSAGTPNSRI